MFRGVFHIRYIILICIVFLFSISFVLSCTSSEIECGNECCGPGQTCNYANECIGSADYCGYDGCQADKGENCETCPKDCECGSGYSCVNGNCVVQPDCGDNKCDWNVGENKDNF